MSWGDKQVMLIMPTDFDPPTGLVRDWVGSALSSVPDLVRMRTAFVTAELVDHAWRHGLGPYVLHIAVDHTRRVLLIAVEDELPTLGVGWQNRAGLILLAGMSERWGVECTEAGKAVWAEMLFAESEPLQSAVDVAVDEGDLGEP